MMKFATAASLGAAKLAALPVALSGGSTAVDFDISTIMQSAVDTTKAQMFSVLLIVAPAIVVVTGAVVGLKFGVGWLKRLKA